MVAEAFLKPPLINDGFHGALDGITYHSGE